MKKEKNYVGIVLAILAGIVVLAIIGVAVMFSLFKNVQKTTVGTVEASSEATAPEKGSSSDDFSAIYGGWESESYFEFREDGTFGWYKSSEDLQDNYYSGDMTVLRGMEACDELGITLDRVLLAMNFSDGEVGLEDIYCITCNPTYLISGGVDKSDKLSGEMKLLFVLVKDDYAQALNMASMDSYYLTKIK